MSAATNQVFKLSKDTPATAIPAGDELTLPAGTEVFVTQTLGGTVTVRTNRGLFRLAREHYRRAGRILVGNAKGRPCR
jgi:hypothetical protein